MVKFNNCFQLNKILKLRQVAIKNLSKIIKRAKILIDRGIFLKMLKLKIFHCSKKIIALGKKQKNVYVAPLLESMIKKVTLLLRLMIFIIQLKWAQKVLC